jgi:hypothetical protein
VGDELWLYTSIRGRNHHQQIVPGGRAGTEVHSLQRDRWVGYAAGARTGELLTQPLPRGRRIALNVQATAGHIRVAILDADGRTIEGFKHDESVPLTGDGLELQLTWSGGRTAADLPQSHQTLRLRLMLQNAEVFAVEA